MALQTVAYLAAGILFILSLSGLSTQETARRGNLYGIVGMAIAIAATLLDPSVLGGSDMVVGYGVIAGSAASCKWNPVTVCKQHTAATVADRLVKPVQSFVCNAEEGAEFLARFQ